VLIDAHMPNTHRQALQLMLIFGTDITEIPAFKSVEVRRLWSASDNVKNLSQILGGGSRSG
jgi:hypothetical protein